MTGYLALTCTWPQGRDEELTEILAGTDVLGARFDDESGAGAMVTIYLDESLAVEASRLADRLEASGGCNAMISPVVAHDWLASYRETVRPFAVGETWWIDPHPEDPTPAPVGRLRLEVEQRSAFGSGSHESTQLALMGLEETQVRGRSVLDVGTGSGILALAAQAAGAEVVVAFDLDSEAVWVARSTIRNIGREPRILLFAGPLEAVGRGGFNIVVCNMISSQFEPLLPEIRRIMDPAGRVVLSGLLTTELEDVTNAAARAGLVVENHRMAGEWSSVTAVTDVQ